jgi:hypothetical protein
MQCRDVSCTVVTDTCSDSAISRSLRPRATAWATAHCAPVKADEWAASGARETSTEYPALTSSPPPGASRTAFGGLGLAGVGLVAAALPLDHPSGDPAELSSWLGSWHALVHMTGFLAAAAGGITAVVAVALAARGVTPRLPRASTAVAAVSVLSLALPGAVGWYGFLAAFFGWTAAVAARRPVQAAAFHRRMAAVRG